jgi:hypothetical protein
MPITLPRLDYSPIYRALEGRRSATQATFLPQSWDLQQRGLDLRERERKAGVAELVIGTGLRLADTVIGMISSAKMEAAKGELIRTGAEAQKKVYEDIYNGRYEVVQQGSTAAAEMTGGPVEGGSRIRLTGDFDTWYQQQLDGIDERYKAFPQVKGWARTQMEQIRATSEAAMYQYAYEKADKDRGALFDQNLKQAIDLEISSGQAGAVDALLSGTTWLSPERRDTIGQAARRDVHLGLAKRDIGYAAEDGYDAAAERAQALATNDAERQALLQFADQEAKLRQGRYTDAASTRMQQGIEAGEPVNLTVDRLLEATPAGYREDVEKVLRGQQAKAVSGRTMADLDAPDVRNNYEAVDALYKRVLANEDGRYDLSSPVIALQHKQDLDEIEARLKRLAPTEAGGSEEDNLLKGAALSKLVEMEDDIKRGAGFSITPAQGRAEAKKMMWDLASKGVFIHDPVRAFLERITDADSTMTPGQKAVVNSLDDMVMRAAQEARRYSTKGDSEDFAYLQDATAYLEDLKDDILKEDPNIDGTKLRERLTGALRYFYGAEADALRNMRVRERARQSVESQIAPIVAMLQAPGSADIVFEKSFRDNPVMAPAMEQMVGNTISWLQDRLAKELGEPDASKVTWTYERDPQNRLQDITPRPEFSYKGQKYRFATDDGKTIQLEKRIWDATARDESWVPLTELKPTPPALRPEPAKSVPAAQDKSRSEILAKLPSLTYSEGVGKSRVWKLKRAKFDELVKEYQVDEQWLRDLLAGMQRPIKVAE